MERRTTNSTCPEERCPQNVCFIKRAIVIVLFWGTFASTRTHGVDYELVTD